MPLRSRRRIGCPLFIIYSSGSPSHGTEKKRNEGIQIEKGIKLFVSEVTGDDMILYTENPKDATRKLLGLINKYSKVTGHTKIRCISIHQQSKVIKKN